MCKTTRWPMSQRPTNIPDAARNMPSATAVGEDVAHKERVGPMLDVMDSGLARVAPTPIGRTGGETGGTTATLTSLSDGATGGATATDRGSVTPVKPAAGREGWGEGGRTGNAGLNADAES